MSKKTESIEIRLSPELKAALARVSDGKGATMSETVRHLIEGEVDGRGSPQPETGEPIMLKSTYTRALRAVAFALPILALAFVYLVSAQSPATASAEARIFFAELDGDGDDRITLPEVEAFGAADGWQPDPDCAATGAPCTLAEEAAEHFARADADGSGEVTFAELEALVMRDRAEDFLDADIDENGSINVDEIIAVELYHALQNPEEMEADGVILSAACRAQFDAERLQGLAQTCGFEAEARAELAAYDADRSGSVTLLEFLDR